MESPDNEMFPILNPMTPDIFVPPEILVAALTATYLVVGITGMFLWDILSHIGLDWRLIFEHRVGFPTIVCFISRISTFSYLLLQTIFVTAPLPNCHDAVLAQEGCYFVASSATSFLFFLRVRAIYNRERYVVAAFSLLWLANLGCYTLAFFLVGGMTIGPTKHCTYTDPNITFIAIPAISVFVFDTAVFLAISARLYNAHNISINGPTRTTTLELSQDGESGFVAALKRFLSGNNLPRLSRTLLKDGQAYYFLVFLTTALIVILNFTPSPAPAFHLMTITPHIALANSMSCYVYRNIRFGTIRERDLVSMGSVAVNSGPSFVFNHNHSHSHRHGPSGSGNVNTTVTATVARGGSASVVGNLKRNGSVGSAQTKYGSGYNSDAGYQAQNHAGGVGFPTFKYHGYGDSVPPPPLPILPPRVPGPQVPRKESFSRPNPGSPTVPPSRVNAPVPRKESFSRTYKNPGTPKSQTNTTIQSMEMDEF